MCNPAVFYAVTAVVTAATAVYSANQQKHATEKALKSQQNQIDQQASANMEDRTRAAREQRAAARAAAAESGVSGNSADAVLNDIMMQSGRDVARIEKNRENGIAETSAQARARVGEINGQLTASVAGSALEAGGRYGKYAASQQRWFADNPTPAAGQKYQPIISIDKQKLTI